MYGEEDLPVLFGEDGVPVVIGAVTTVGLLDDLPASAFGERAPVQARARSVLVQSSVLPTLHVGDAITVAGTGYRIREWGPDPDALDGALSRILLQDAA